MRVTKAWMLKKSGEKGIIKYAIAWWLGVPISLLLVIMLFARGC